MLLDEHSQRNWDWLHSKWKPIGYRTKQLILKVVQHGASGKWWPFGSGTNLRFERMLDVTDGQWPHDREVVDVHFNTLGHLKSFERYKIIYVERGKSHADLHRVLGEQE